MLAFKAFQIINYFSENPKDNPMVVTVSLLFSFFSQLLHFHGLNDKSPRNVAAALKVNPYFVNDYVLAAQANERAFENLLEEYAFVRDASISLFSTFSEADLLKLGTASKAVVIAE